MDVSCGREIETSKIGRIKWNLALLCELKDRQHFMNFVPVRESIEAEFRTIKFNTRPLNMVGLRNGILPKWNLELLFHYCIW